VSEPPTGPKEQDWGSIADPQPRIDRSNAIIVILCPAPHESAFRFTDWPPCRTRAPAAETFDKTAVAAVSKAVSLLPVVLLIRFEDVGLRYGMGEEVVSDLNFSIAPQSFQFLTGPSGAGKTTLLRLMLLSLRPTRGAIHIFGRDAAALRKDELTALRRRIGVVFQDFRLLDHLTTYENVALPLRALGRAESSYRAEVVELLRWVGLGQRMNAVPPVLSGGEKQRAAIARALIVRPELLLADEPTGNVDPGLARRLLRLFVELHRLGTAVVIATHDLQLMDQCGFARRLVVGEGKVAIFEGASE
jgi:cell division transport system ATP-binding protein